VNRFLLSAAALCAALLSPAARAANSAYTCTVFTYSASDWVVNPTGINNSGQVVGYATDSNQISHGFLRNPDGAIVAIDTPGAAGLGSTEPQAINNAGQIAGMYYVGTDAHGFMRNAEGSYTEIAPPVPPDSAGPGSTIYGFCRFGH
jgi:probable HAF family extracellular repeat protein